MEYLDTTKVKKEEYTEIIEKIAVPNSPVAIDAQYTHAIVIEFLKQISQRLDNLEKTVAQLKKA